MFATRATFSIYFGSCIFQSTNGKLFLFSPSSSLTLFSLSPTLRVSLSVIYLSLPRHYSRSLPSRDSETQSRTRSRRLGINSLASRGSRNVRLGLSVGLGPVLGSGLGLHLEPDCDGGGGGVRHKLSSTQLSSGQLWSSSQLSSCTNINFGRFFVLHSLGCSSSKLLNALDSFGTKKRLIIFAPSRQ